MKIPHHNPATHYFSNEGKLRKWSDIYNHGWDFLKGEHEYPHKELYKNDSRVHTWTAKINRFFDHKRKG